MRREVDGALTCCSKMYHPRNRCATLVISRQLLLLLLLQPAAAVAVCIATQLGVRIHPTCITSKHRPTVDRNLAALGRFAASQDQQ